MSINDIDLSIDDIDNSIGDTDISIDDIDIGNVSVILIKCVFFFVTSLYSQ